MQKTTKDNRKRKTEKDAKDGERRERSVKDEYGRACDGEQHSAIPR